MAQAVSGSARHGSRCATRRSPHHREHPDQHRERRAPPDVECPTSRKSVRCRLIGGCVPATARISGVTDAQVQVRNHERGRHEHDGNGHRHRLAADLHAPSLWLPAKPEFRTSHRALSRNSVSRTASGQLNRSASARRSTLPIPRTGSSSTRCSSRGAAVASSDASDVLAQLRQRRRRHPPTPAPPRRPPAGPAGRRARRTPRTAPTAGCRAITASTSSGSTVNPPVLMALVQPAVHRAARRRRRGCRRRRCETSPVRRTGWATTGLRYPLASVAPPSTTRPSSTRTRTPSSGTPSYTHPPAVSLMPYVRTTETPAAEAPSRDAGRQRAAADQHRVE